MENPARRLKEAYETFLWRFRDEMIPRYPSIKEWMGRDREKSLVVAKSKMIDLASNIYQAATGADTNGETLPVSPTNPHGRKGAPLSLALPFCAFAVSPDATPMRGEHGRRLPIRPMRLPHDTQQREFRLRIDQYLMRIQTIFYAAEVDTAREMAQQFILFLQAPLNARLELKFSLLGHEYPFDALITDRDLLPSVIDTNLSRVHGVAVDSEWRVKIPTLFGKDGIIDEDDTPDPDVVDGLDLIVQAIIITDHKPDEVVLLEGTGNV